MVETTSNNVFVSFDLPNGSFVVFVVVCIKVNS